MKAVHSAADRGLVAESTAVPSPAWTSRSLFDLRRIKQFEAVARHLNITRAATEMYLSQQAVSAAIKSLERELGVKLFERVGRHLELTPSGAALRDGSTALLDASAALTRTVYDAREPRQRPLELVFSPEVSTEEVTDLATAALAAVPSASITVRQVLPSEIRTELRSGRADVALARGAVEQGHLDMMTVGRTPLRVAISSAHRLAGRAIISFNDLARDTLILPGPAGESPYTSFLLAVCRHAGIEPVTVTSTLRGVTHTAAVIDSSDYALVTADPGRYHRDRVVVSDITPPPFASLHALWLPHTDNRLRHAILTALRHQSEESSPSTETPIGTALLDVSKVVEARGSSENATLSNNVRA